MNTILMRLAKCVGVLVALGQIAVPLGLLVIALIVRILPQEVWSPIATVIIALLVIQIVLTQVALPWCLDQFATTLSRRR